MLPEYSAYFTYASRRLRVFSKRMATMFLFFQLAFEDPEVQGIYLLTDGKPVSLMVDVLVQTLHFFFWTCILVSFSVFIWIVTQWEEVLLVALNTCNALLYYTAVSFRWSRNPSPRLKALRGHTNNGSEETLYNRVSHSLASLHAVRIPSQNSESADIIVSLTLFCSAIG